MIKEIVDEVRKDLENTGMSKSEIDDMILGVHEMIKELKFNQGLSNADILKKVREQIGM